ncbi:MAG: hypothetical protein ICV78_19920 [Tolypothrix sp. Co-bin9]|nr:hypothetical protein [Tolypothrix sp. Co-bin9]
MQALQDKLRKIIDDAVESGGKDGFKVVFSDLENLIPSGIHGEKEPEKNYKLGNLAARKQQLVDEILNLKYLPTENDFLVVVTGVNSKKGFLNAEVWRGLSSRINLKDEEWESANNRDNTIISAIIKFFTLQKLLQAIIIISLAVNIWAIPQLLYQKSANEQNHNLKIENQEMKKENNYLKIDKNNLDVQIKDKLTQKSDLKISVEHLQQQIHDLESQVKPLEDPSISKLGCS